MSISVQFNELSGRAVFPAKAKEQRTGARGEKGERGRFRNLANLLKVQHNTRRHSKALRVTVRHEGPDNELSWRPITYGHGV